MAKGLKASWTGDLVFGRELNVPIKLMPAPHPEDVFVPITIHARCRNEIGKRNFCEHCGNLLVAPAAAMTDDAKAISKTEKNLSLLLKICGQCDKVSTQPTKAFYCDTCGEKISGNAIEKAFRHNHDILMLTEEQQKRLYMLTPQPKRMIVMASVYWPRYFKRSMISGSYTVVPNVKKGGVIPYWHILKALIETDLALSVAFVMKKFYRGLIFCENEYLSLVTLTDPIKHSISFPRIQTDAMIVDVLKQALRTGMEDFDDQLHRANPIQKFLEKLKNSAQKEKLLPVLLNMTAADTRIMLQQANKLLQELQKQKKPPKKSKPKKKKNKK